MAGEFPNPRSGLLAAQLLEGLRYAQMDSPSSRAAQTFVEAVLNESMCKREAVTLFADQPRGGRVLEQIQKLVFGALTYRRQQAQVEVAANHGSLRQHRVGGLAKTSNSLADHLAHALGKTNLCETNGG